MDREFYLDLPLQPPGAVVGSCSGFFRGGARELVIATCDSISLYRALDSELELVASLRPAFYITSLQALNWPVQSRFTGDGLLVATRKRTVLVLQWDDSCESFKVLEELDVGSPHSRVEERQDATAPILFSAADWTNGSMLLAIHVQGEHPKLFLLPALGPEDETRLEYSKRIFTPVRLDLTEESEQKMSFRHVVQLLLTKIHKNSFILALVCAPQDEIRHVRLLEGTMKLRSSTKPCILMTLRLRSNRGPALLLPAFGASFAGDCILEIGESEALLTSCYENIISQKKSSKAFPLNLGAAPTCAAAIYDSTFVVGDRGGGITVLRFSNFFCDMTESRLLCKRPPLLPTSLAALPSDAAEGGFLLFAGSWGSPSQLLSCNTALENAALRSNPFDDSLAPIHDAVRLEEPPESGEGSLLMCCGLHPGGSLRWAWMAAALTPSLQGPKLELRPSLSTVKATADSAYDQLLVLSFESAGTTKLLDVSGPHFREAHMPGIDLDSTSLLIARMPSGRVLQVTTKEVRLAGSPDGKGPLLQDAPTAVAVWQPPEGTISMAAYCAATAAVVTGNRVYILPAEGPLGPCCYQRFEEQISAVALLQLGPDLWLAVGQWKTNQVLLQPALRQGGGPAVAVATGQGQPRSILACRFWSKLLLFVGLADGTLLCHHMEADKGTLVVAATRHARIGYGEVDLQWVESVHGRPAHVFASCEQAILVRQRERAEPYSDCFVLESLDFVRVYGADEVISSCSLHIPDLPAARAWVDPSGCLMIGSLEFELKLRSRRKWIGDTPRRVLHDQKTGCFLVLSDDSSGSSWIRLFRTTSMRQLAAVELRGYQATAMCWADLSPDGGGPTQCAVVTTVHESTDEQQFRREHALLHVLEITHEAGDDGRTKYSLLLHGSVAVQSPCYSLATVPDDLKEEQTEGRPSSASDPHWGAHSEQKSCRTLLVAGCKHGVFLYRLVVNSSLGWAAKVVNKAADDIEAGGQVVDEAAGNPPPAVSCQLLTQAKSKEGGAVIQLSSWGCSVLACDLFASTTHYLLRRDADVSVQNLLSRTSADLQCVGRLSAIFMVDSLFAVAGIFPGGLVCFSRSIAAEGEWWTAHSRALAQAREQGTSLPEELADQPEASDLCGILAPGFQLGVSAFCRGHLGSCFGEGSPTKSSNQYRRDPVIYLTREGAVGRLFPWSSFKEECKHMEVHGQDAMDASQALMTHWRDEVTLAAAKLEAIIMSAISPAEPGLSTALLAALCTLHQRQQGL